MSAIKTLSQNADKTKVYEFDFEKNQSSSNEISVGKDELRAGPRFVKMHSWGTDINTQPGRFFCINKRNLAYTSARKIGEDTGSRIKNISLDWYREDAQVIGIYDGTEFKVLVMDGNGKAELLGERILNLSIIPGRFLTYLNRKLFYVKNSVICFTDSFDYIDELEGKETTQYIKLEDGLGSIAGMYSVDNQLIVVCIHGIVTISLSRNLEEYQIKRINVHGLNVITQSVSPSGKHVCFISNEEFCVFDGNKVNFFNLFDNVKEVLECGVHLGYYIFSYEEDGTNKTMAIDITTKEKILMPYRYGISKNGGYARDDNYATYAFSRRNNSNTSSSYESVGIDFGTAKEKRLLGVEAYSNGKASLIISGDFGEKNLEIDGYKVYKCNEKSKSFVVNLNLKHGAMPFKNLKLKYRIVGE